jgi:hypothetical protein
VPSIGDTFNLLASANMTGAFDGVVFDGFGTGANLVGASATEGFRLRPCPSRTK